MFMFAPLNESQIEQIVRLQISLIQKTLKENGITLNLTEAAIHFIADEGFDPQFGARPVKRAIQKYVLNDLSKQLIAGTVHNNEAITVDFDGEVGVQQYPWRVKREK